MSIVRKVARAGAADGGAGDRVDFVDGVAPSLHRAQHSRHAVEGNVVANEVRRVLRDDHALAEHPIAELVDGMHSDGRIIAARRDQFEQAADSAAG